MRSNNNGNIRAADMKSLPPSTIHTYLYEEELSPQTLTNKFSVSNATVHNDVSSLSSFSSISSMSTLASFWSLSPLPSLVSLSLSKSPSFDSDALSLTRYGFSNLQNDNTAYWQLYIYRRDKFNRSLVEAAENTLNNKFSLANATVHNDVSSLSSFSSISSMSTLASFWSLSPLPSLESLSLSKSPSFDSDVLPLTRYGFSNLQNNNTANEQLYIYRRDKLNRSLVEAANNPFNIPEDEGVTAESVLKGRLMEKGSEPICYVAKTEAYVFRKLNKENPMITQTVSCVNLFELQRMKPQTKEYVQMKHAQSENNLHQMSSNYQRYPSLPVKLDQLQLEKNEDAKVPRGLFKRIRHRIRKLFCCI